MFTTWQTWEYFNYVKIFKGLYSNPHCGFLFYGFCKRLTRPEEEMKRMKKEKPKITTKDNNKNNNINCKKKKKKKKKKKQV